MLPKHYSPILGAEGFRCIGELRFRLHLTVWWNPAPDKLIQLLIVSVGPLAMIKGDKSYYLKSVTSEGETWARDIPALHDYLEHHFPELHISLSHFRDVPPELAEAEVRRRAAVEAPTVTIPTVEEISEMQRQLQVRQQNADHIDEFRGLLSDCPDLLTASLHQQARRERAEVKQFRHDLQRDQERLGAFQHLQREYQQKGSAAVYTFSVSSNLQIAEDPRQFTDAVRAVVKELSDAHRYQVVQKLGSGRLNIRVAEAAEPTITWIEEWFGGAMTPMQTRRLRAAFDRLRAASDERVSVTPDAPIVLDGHVRHAEKHLAARFLSDTLRRLDKSDAVAQTDALSPAVVPAEAMPLTLGRRVEESGRLLGPVTFPLNQIVHVYISGTTGGGKSFLARVLIEEAAQHKGLHILVLDPRNQSVGLLLPEDRDKVLQQYDAFAMERDRARGFPFKYFAPGLPYAPPLPDRVGTLSEGRSIVSFKGLDDRRRCTLAADVLDGVFAASNAQESDRPRLLVLVDEAQLFTRKRLDESAKEAAARAERALDRIAREGRKFGIVLALISQTMKDFGYELASIRQMTTTKIFLRNSDREIEYASDIIGNGRLLVQLPTGTALVHNANWGVVRIRVRPPYSKVYELGEEEVRKLVGQISPNATTVTAAAQRLMQVILQYQSGHREPLNMSRASELAGISSKRRLLELIRELEDARLIRTRKLLERGQPRVIESVRQI